MMTKLVRSIWIVVLCIGMVCTVSSNAYAACTSPTGEEGDVVYNNDFDVIQYCDGSGWYKLGAKAAGLLAEADPQISGVGNNLWCRGNGTSVNCSVATVTATETDPQIGTINQRKWCVVNGAGTAIDCTSTNPTTSVANGLAGMSTSTRNALTPLQTGMFVYDWSIRKLYLHVDGGWRVVQPTCPIGWIKDDIHCYRFFSQALSQPDATLECKKHGAALARISNATDNTFVYNNLGQYTSRMWIEGTDAAVDGTWDNNYNGTLSYFRWASGEPNGGTGENCIAMYGFTFGTSGSRSYWLDQPCTSKLPFICELR